MRSKTFLAREFQTLKDTVPELKICIKLHCNYTKKSLTTLQKSFNQFLFDKDLKTVFDTFSVLNYIIFSEIQKSGPGVPIMSSKVENICKLTHCAWHFPRKTCFSNLPPLSIVIRNQVSNFCLHDKAPFQFSNIGSKGV